MGKFPWTQGHHKQPSDKYIPSPEWFTKSSAEPSRQALNDLVKEQLAGEFDSTVARASSRTRSRSGTLSSVRSHRAKSSTDRSVEIKSRPQSRQSIMEEAPSSPTRHEPVPRNLFSMGSRIMRRKTSRLTLLPSQLEEASAEGGPRDSDPSKLDFAAQFRNLSAKRASVKPSISGPFDFQHVTHTDQGQFQSLNTATRTELASGFSALQAGQAPAAEIKGIVVADLPASPEASASQDGAQLPSPTSAITPELPTTPPRPTPPPKDDPLPLPSPNMRLSKSVENFSRLTRSPAVGVEISSISEVAPESDVHTSNSGLLSAPSSPLSWADATNETLSGISSRRQSVAPLHLLDKPLPLPPTLVHAVSTADDSALPLRTAPLPQLPQMLNIGGVEAGPVTSSQATEARPQTPHRSSLRHMQTFPSPKAARRRSQSSGEMILGHTAIAAALASSFVSQMPKPQPKRRTSIGIKKIDIEDWEDAIEYSWDHPPDLDDDLHQGFDRREALNRPCIAKDSSQTMSTQTTTNRPHPLKLTPVIEQESSQSLPDPTLLQSPTTGYTDQNPVRSSLYGLGIESFRPTTAVHVEATSGLDRGSKTESLRTPATRRAPGSSISKSSSQESIILSIASSILGTHRSSNSSTSLSDMSHLDSIKDESYQAESVKGHNSDSSQETVTTEPQSVSTPATEFPSPLNSNNPSPAHKRERGASISRFNVPNRTSSIAPAKSTPSVGRQRSNTLNGRPKNARTSYSLFPTARPQPT